MADPILAAFVAAAGAAHRKVVEDYADRRLSDLGFAPRAVNCGAPRAPCVHRTLTYDYDLDRYTCDVCGAEVEPAGPAQVAASVAPRHAR